VIGGGGYVAEVTWTGNTLTIIVRQSAGAVAPLAEVAAGTDLSGVNFLITYTGI